MEVTFDFDALENFISPPKFGVWGVTKKPWTLTPMAYYFKDVDKRIRKSQITGLKLNPI